jgi:histidinol dehydrogenase
VAQEEVSAVALLIPTFEVHTGSASELALLDARRPAPAADVSRVVQEVVEAVRTRGDEALLEYERRFDCETLTAERLRVTPEEIERAYDAVPDAWLSALRLAVQRVEAYHRKQLPNSWLDFGDGETLGQKVTPISSVGIYAPGGLAPYPSSLIMAAIPARVAGVKRRVVATPPRKDGSVAPVLLVAARECGVDEVYRMGGAQAIAALGYGTKTVAPVDKIVGPGNEYVVAAKRIVFGQVGIDGIPGPSEAVIIADETANAEWVAADLLSQAEHGHEAPIYLVTTSRQLAEAVARAAQQQADGLSRRDCIEQAITSAGGIVLVPDLQVAAAVANHIAPEHLELVVARPERLLEKIENAGCIFLGDSSPIPAGDYLAGPSHILPTGRTARFASGLSVDDFLKKSSIVSLSADRLAELALAIEALAEAEGFDAHASAVKMRRLASGGDS